ncbi:MAG TPA: lipopolysaccharide biosynthesis protein RfbH [Spirochaetota bacterium]|nr:lipopolysaccharide biosynthesis protein RfbH [Spirochaetota bacterium]
MVNWKGKIVLLNPFPESTLDGERTALALSDADESGDVEFVFVVQADGAPTGTDRTLILSGESYLGPSLAYDAVVILKKYVFPERLIKSSLAEVKAVTLASLFREFTLDMAGQYYLANEESNRGVFVPGASRVNYAGRVYDEREIRGLVDASLEFWLTYGKHSIEFERRLAEYLGVKHAFLVNSGSSANLLAFMALTSPLLNERRIERGDEVITVAACFPTTVAPIVQYGAIPVFVDVDLETTNVNVARLTGALSPRTKAVFLAHTLGNPFDIAPVKDWCAKHRLWLIEDNCDALGSRYRGRLTGTWGDIGTSSFYPPHHMTMGEGGAVYTNDATLKKILLSMRDWGRDCWCDSGMDNTCKKRFSGQFGTLPFGYDHKYVYSHLGYNLKATDLQAAIGCAQLDKLPDFTEKRKRNFSLLREALSLHESVFILPRATSDSDPSWFGFLLTLRDGAGFSRNEIVAFLEDGNIQTRNLFAGNITRHPCFVDLVEGRDYRIAGCLENTDKIMNDSFWVGVYPGMSDAMLRYIAERIDTYVSRTQERKG